jgi:RNA processing factor Prp31
MLSDFMKRSLRREIVEQLTEARRQLRDQEQTLARLNYEWSIARRLRHQARSEDEREKWRVQSDAYMGLVMQQESVIAELEESINFHQSRLEELGPPLTDDDDQ